MKTKEEIKPNYGPVYSAALYPELCKIFQKHGYALAVHGSLARDFDLIAVPWTDDVSPIETVFGDIEKTFAIKCFRDGSLKKHGRMCYTLAIGFGECAVDLSFMPVLTNKEEKKAEVKSISCIEQKETCKWHDGMGGYRGNPHNNNLYHVIRDNVKEGEPCPTCGKPIEIWW
jgi:hypothetical protein